MKKVFKALRHILGIILCFVLLVNAWFLIERFVLHEKLPSVHGYSQAVVLSGSMEPTFSAGDLLVFREQKKYSVGDVVIFPQDGALITHRIVDVRPGGFVTRGDANKADDPMLLNPDSIYGSLVRVVPKLGSIMSFLRSPVGILILAIIGLALVETPRIADSMRKRVKHDGCTEH